MGRDYVVMITGALTGIGPPTFGKGNFESKFVQATMSTLKAAAPAVRARK